MDESNESKESKESKPSSPEPHQTASKPSLIEDQPDVEASSPSPAKGQGDVSPDVDWSDDTNPVKYTFYRECTPTPPEYADDAEKRLRASLAPSGLAAAAGLNDAEGGSSARESTEGRTHICGIRRFVFWWIVAIVAVILVAVAVGLGVGLGYARGTKSSTGSAPSGVPLAEPTSTTEAPTSTPTSTPPSSTECPDTNGTVYTVPVSGKQFLQLCGVDYGPTEAVDLGQVLAETMEDCINSCSIFPGCEACGWGYIDGDQNPEYRCWMKSNLQERHQARSNWSFAILQ